MKKQIIYTDDEFYNEDARKEYQEEMREIFEDDDWTLTDGKWAEAVASWLDDEKVNLNKVIDGIILAFASIGRWNGRFHGFKILGSNINDIFSVHEDENEWYGDGKNIRATLSHHDGTHHVLYRVVKDEEAAERVAELIYNNEIDETGFIKRTRPLYPHVAKIYGWKIQGQSKTA